MAISQQLISLLEKQYNYFIENNYIIYSYGCHKDWGWHNVGTGIIHKDNFDNIVKRLELETYTASKVSNYETYLKLIDKYSYITPVKIADNNQPLLESVKFLYQSYPKDRKTIFASFQYICDIPLNEAFPDLLELSCTNKKDTLAFTKSFVDYPIDIRNIDLFNLDNYLGTKLSTQEIDEFFFNYFQKKEKKINLPSNFSIVRDFLIHKYKDQPQILEQYFPFLPALKNEFVFEFSVKDIFKPVPTYATIVDIDLNKCIKIITIDKWGINDYRMAVSQMSNSIVKYFSVSEQQRETPSGIKGMWRLTFLHENANLTSNLVEEIMFNFLIDLKSNPQLEKSDKDMESWLSHYLLRKKINEADIPVTNPSTKKKKI